MSLKLIARYDECQIIADNVAWLLESGGAETEKEAEAMTFQDIDLLSIVWDDMKDALTAAMEALKTKKKWMARGSNLGWRQLSGQKTFMAQTATELLSNLLPTTDVTVEIFTEGRAIIIKCWHHDAPTGETYRVTPIRKLF